MDSRLRGNDGESVSCISCLPHEAYKPVTPAAAMTFAHFAVSSRKNF